jgi:hypothetical protein
MTKKAEKPDTMNIEKVFRWFETQYAWEKEIPLSLQPGNGQIPLLVITGENASGKSLLRRLFQALAKKKNVEAIAVSPEFRSKAGFANAFIYGDESYEASGQIACKVILGAIKTSRAREKPHIIILDEPDMGLSDNAAAGCGQEIVDFCLDPPQNLGFFAVITHRRAMLAPFANVKASHLRVGDNLTLQEVVDQPIVPVAPKDLCTRSLEMFRRVAKLLKE